MDSEAERVANTPEQVARFVQIFQAGPIGQLIANLQTEVDQITVAGRSYPISLNSRGQTGNCYICNPVTAYIDYAIDETRNFIASPLLRHALRGVINACAPLVRASGIDHQVQINNWLLSTNPVPALSDTAAAALCDALVQRYPDRALVLRCLNTRADAASLRALQAQGFILLPARQIYLYDPRADQTPKQALRAPSPDMRRDLKALSKTRYQLVPHDGFSGADFTQSAQLYAQLYLQKYTPLNPQYTPRYVEAMHAAGLMQLRGLRCPDSGDLVAMTGFFINGRTLTQPIVGYDTARPQREGLYRMVMAMAQDHARSEGLFFNMSAGAAAFKRHRQAQPVIEYTAVYAQHLPKHRRLALAAMAQVLTRIGIPLLQRFEL